MAPNKVYCAVILLFFFCGAASVSNRNQKAELVVNASGGRQIPETFFGIFFEEINHAGAGGLWAELVSNRGFEAVRQNKSLNIHPWSLIGDESSIIVSTDRSSCFKRNKIALRMEVLCDGDTCPVGGVGVYNPGFWGMDIKQGKIYKIVFYLRSLISVNISVSLSSSDGLRMLAITNLIASARHVSNWTKMETLLEAEETNPNARLQLKTSKKGVMWIDQVSAIPLDTHKGHGFRNDLYEMIANIKPRFLRFPGGNFVGGDLLRNAFRWKDTVGPWEERPGHFNDAWNYWTDDGLGYFEFLQLSEDLGALPIWVFNNGMSNLGQEKASNVSLFVQEALEGIEFAIGDPSSKWGSVRAAMRHPKPFDLRYVAVGNEECYSTEKNAYKENYPKFYDAIKRYYPDIKVISNCDESVDQLDHPTDLYDFHIYTNANDLFSKAHHFDHTSRSGPKVFVSEYAVSGKDGGTGSLLAALGEAGFLVGLERNSDVVAMVCYAPLFVNVHDRSWNPDAIVFNSNQAYGTPSYWLQHFFIDTSGAMLLNTTLLTNSSTPILASAIAQWNSNDNICFLKVKVVNFGSNKVNLKISVYGLESNSINSSRSTKTLLTSNNVMDENSFKEPNKVVPRSSPLENAGKDMEVVVSPHSVTSYDLMLERQCLGTMFDEAQSKEDNCDSHLPFPGNCTKVQCLNACMDKYKTSPKIIINVGCETNDKCCCVTG
ncbi:alpha-L-arabinofuranosidase 1-like [Pistacia vera]|uniref:alpha-L-arabinofuranosidase 1-like n=1 Tax=Pistacia vera TaxID=55513 RepID=UPI00126385C8|nr:alpha-L-arabinofuranosidase 1-like [Pistacia vera]